MAAVIFSALSLVAFLPIGPSLDRVSDPAFRQYFSQSFRETQGVYNTALSENRSVENVKQELYSYTRFVEERSENKGIEFQAYLLAVLPGKGEAVLINYRNSRDYSLYAGGSWTNTTLEEKQFLEKSFTPGKTSISLVAGSDTYSFDAATPRLVYWMSMSSTGETWENSYTG